MSHEVEEETIELSAHYQLSKCLADIVASLHDFELNCDISNRFLPQTNVKVARFGLEEVEENFN